MIQFISLHIRGFCSIGECYLQLNTPGITIIRGANGNGKAQPLNEPVLTPTGWIPIGKLKPGDLVINPVNGLPIKVNSVHDRGKLPTYKIRFSDGTYTRCADDHLWSVYKSGKTRYKLRTLDTKTLLEDYKYENKSRNGTYKYRYSIPLTKPVDFGNTEPLPIHPYVLGFILGDGCISGSRPAVRVSTNFKDWEEVVNRLRSYLPDPSMIHIGTTINGTIKHFRIHGLGKELKELGLLGKKSKDKFIPEIYLRSSVENRKLLLAGLLDTDAHVGSGRKKSKVSEYTSKSKKLRDGVVDLVRSLGGISKKNRNRRYKYGRYTVTYGCSIRLPYIPFLRGYKVSSFGEFSRRNRMVNTIRDIQYIGNIESRCITVDSLEGLYITRDYIVTHNSSIFSALVWCLYGKNLKGVSNVNTWPESQPKDYKGTYVDVYFQKGEDTYQIIRCLNFKDILEDGAKGNSRLILIKNAEMIDIKGKNSLQEEIVRVLGMSYSLFMNSIMFGQGIKRLIQESNQDKKKIFEEVFDLEYLNIAKGIAMDDRNGILKDINQVENESKILKAQLMENRETYFKLREQEKTFTSKIKEERRSLKKERKELTAVLMKKKKGISEEVDKSLPMKIKNTKESISQVQSSIKAAKQISNQRLDKVVDSIIGLLEKGKYNTAKSKLISIRDAFINIDKYHDELQSLQERLYSLNQTQTKYEKLKSECKDISYDIAEIDQEIKNLGLEKKSIISPEYREKIRKIRKKLRKVDEDYHNKVDELKDYDWLIDDPLGNNGIKAYIFDSSLGFLNQELGKYADVLGFLISFEVNLQGARKEFVTTIELNGHYAEYDELSGGQKQLCNIAMAFAMNQSLTASKGINIAFLDEVFESLSSDNVEIVCQLIQKVFEGKTLFLISHIESLPIRNSRILQVEKEDGLSCYKTL